MVWILIAPFLAEALVEERRTGSADAIVILSGAADYKQRATGGADAYRNGLARTVILTDDGQRGGWEDVEKGNPYFIDRSARVLADQGVPVAAIERMAGQVHGTDEEADLLVRVAKERGYRRLLIVTSEFHSRRALWTFDRAVLKQGSDLAVGLVTSPSGPQYPTRRSWWLSVRGLRTVAGEYVKFGYYWLYY